MPCYLLLSKILYCNPGLTGFFWPTDDWRKKQWLDCMEQNLTYFYQKQK